VATRVQFVCNWPPVPSISCMRLAATRVQFVCDWLPFAYIFCMQLAATQEQLVCHWPPEAHYFSTIWQIVLTFSSKTERLHGQSAIAQTSCMASFCHASKPVRLKSYFNLSPGSLEKRLDLQLKVIFTEAWPTLLNSKHILCLKKQ
jgi:hypothetical protein